MIVLQLIKTAVGASWALRQMRELVKLGVKVHVAMPTDGPMVKLYQKDGITVHPYQFDFSFRNPIEMRKRFAQLRQLVEEVKPDLIHSHFVGTTLTMRLALGGNHPIPRVFQVPGPLHLEHRFFRTMELATAGKADRWIGSCRWTCATYRKAGVDENRVFLSFYGTDLEEIRPGVPGKLRGELGVSDQVPLVGMVAYMYAPKRYLMQTRGLKGHEDLIDALAICQAAGQNMHGVFIGAAWANATDYEKKVMDYGYKKCGDKITFLGTRYDVPELYPDINIAVHPSHSENLGGAAESLLMGIPTIATDVGGFPDIVHPGRTGWLVPAKSPAALAAIIQHVLSDPAGAQQIAAQGQTLARDLLDVRRTSAEVLDIYRKIV